MKIWLLVLCLFYSLCLGSCAVDDDDDASEASDDDTIADEDTVADNDSDDDSAAGRWGLPGWHIVGDDYLTPSEIDGMSFEWDYFMVHNADGSFTGSVGYLIANPRNREDLFGSLVPKGGNVAIAGSLPSGERVAEYRNFGYEGFLASADFREFHAENAATGDYGTMTPLPDENALILAGRTTNFEWSLRVSQEWKALSNGEQTFVPEQGNDVGVLRPDEEKWNVDMLWPRTRVTGTITDRQSGDEIIIDGNGYRENSWGRWAFNLGGWDFAVVTDLDAGVSWAWQTYHYESVDLDYLDLGFYHDGELQLEHFRSSDGELGWRHDHWMFNTTARQCVPKDAFVVAQNDRYRVEASVEVGAEHAPMLSDATVATKWYVIFILFPHISGQIIDRQTEEVVAEFAGQGGGEFSVYRSAETTMTEQECAAWGQTRFFSPLPE